MKPKYVSLIHRLTNKEWIGLVDNQAICRAFQRYVTNWHTPFGRRARKTYAYFKDIRNRFSVRERRELNDFVERNGLDIKYSALKELVNAHTRDIEPMEMLLETQDS